MSSLTVEHFLHNIEITSYKSTFACVLKNILVMQLHLRFTISSFFIYQTRHIYLAYILQFSYVVIQRQDCSILFIFVDESLDIHGDGRWLGPVLLGVYMLLTNILLLNLLIAIFKYGRKFIIHVLHNFYIINTVFRHYVINTLLILEPHCQERCVNCLPPLHR